MDCITDVGLLRVNVSVSLRDSSVTAWYITPLCASFLVSPPPKLEDFFLLLLLLT